MPCAATERASPLPPPLHPRTDRQKKGEGTARAGRACVPSSVRPYRSGGIQQTGSCFLLAHSILKTRLRVCRASAVEKLPSPKLMYSVYVDCFSRLRGCTRVSGCKRTCFMMVRLSQKPSLSPAGHPDRVRRRRPSAALRHRLLLFPAPNPRLFILFHKAALFFSVRR